MGQKKMKRKHIDREMEEKKKREGKKVNNIREEQKKEEEVSMIRGDRKNERSGKVNIQLCNVFNVLFYVTLRFQH